MAPTAPPAPPVDEASADEASPAAAAAASAPAAVQPAGKQAAQEVWLATSSHGGTMLGWRVPLTAGPPAPGRPGPAITPYKLPVSHTRSIFTLHAAAAAAPWQPPAAASNGSGGAEPAAAQAGQQPELQLLTSSMDRTLLLTRLPHPAAAAQEVLAEAPEGSWRRDSAAGAASEAAWKQAAVSWRLTGLGGHVYSLSLLLPAASAHPQGGQQVQEQQEQEPSAAPPLQQQREQEQAAVPADAEEDVPPPPPPPPAPEAAAAGEQHDAAEELQPSAVAVQLEAAAAPPVATPAAAAVPLLLAVGCGDKTVRMLPMPASAAWGEVSSGQQKQLLLWQSIPEKVTAVAWQPLLADAAAALNCAAAPAAAVTGASTAAAAAASVLAFGCEDGSVGLLLPSREQALLLPVRHKVRALGKGGDRGCLSRGWG